jgi:transcription factor C subunit 3
VDFKRLALAVALARTICGGTGNLQVTNYDAVALALGSKHEVEDLKHYWQLPRKHGYDLAFAKRLQQAMYDPFLQAYENGELPRVEFNDLQNTEWAALLDWADAKVLPLFDGGALEQLPKERGELQAVLTTLLPSPEEVNSQDTLPNASNQLAAPVRQRGQNLVKVSSVLDQNYVLEKSWIRAVMITKDEVYDENVAANKLSSVLPEVLEKATQEMLDTKTIKWKKVDRQQPGRSYMISPYTISQFERWPRSHGSDFLSSLVTARTDFVGHFQQYDRLELSTDVTEAQLTVLTNMVSQGQLMMSPLLPKRNDDFDAPGPKWSKWCPLKGAYDEEQAALPPLDIKVVYKKTPLFTSDNGLKVDIPVPTDVPSFPGESGTRIPFWFDINGNVMVDMWSKVVESILHLLVNVPGCTAKSIERAHDSKLWEWEIDIVLEWMEAVGLAKQTGRGKDVHGSRKGGWRVSELWHFVSLVTATRSEENRDEDTVEDGEAVEV